MRTAVVTILLIFTILLGAVLAVPRWVDWTAHRGVADSAIGWLTGWQVETQGDIAFQILPYPQLDLGRVRIVSGPVGWGSISGQVEALRAVGTLDGMVSGRLDLDRLILVTPDLHWRRPDGAIQRGPVPGNGGGLGSGARSAADQADGWLRFGSADRLTVESGRLVVSGGDMAPLALNDLSVSGEVGGLPGPFDLAMTGRLQDLAIGLSARSGPPTRSGALPLTLTAELPGLPGDLRFAGLFQGGDTLSGEFDMMLPDAGAWWQTLTDMPTGGVLEVPDDQAGTPVSVSVRSMAELGPDGLRLTGLQTALGNAIGQGSVTVDWQGEPVIGLSMAIDALDLSDAWLGLGTVFDAFLAPNPTDPNAAFTWPGVPGLHLVADLSVETVQIADGLFDDVILSAHSDGSDIHVDHLTASGPGQTQLHASGRLGLSEDGAPAVAINTRVEGSDLRALLTALRVDTPATPANRLRDFSLTGRIEGVPGDLRISGGDIQIDATQVNLALAYLNQGAVGLGLRVDVDRVDLDSYDPVGLGGDVAPSVLAAFDLARAMSGQININADATIGSMVLGGETWSDLRLDATVSGGNLSLREMRIGDVAGASLSVGGYVGDLAALSGLDVTVSGRSAPDLRPAFALFGWPLPPALSVFDATAIDMVLGGHADALDVAATLDGAEGHLEFAGLIAGSTQGWGAAHVDGVIRLRTNALSALADAAIGLDTLPPDIGAFDVFAELTVGPDQWVAESVQGMVGPVGFFGSLEQTASNQPITGDLQLGPVAIDAWMDTGDRWPLNRLGGWSTEQVAWIWPDGLPPLDLAIAATALSWNGFEMTAPSLNLALDAASLRIEGLSAQAFDGALAADAMISAGDSPGLTVDLDLDDVAFDAFADTVLRSGGVEGATGLTISVVGEGRTPADLVRSLNGEGSLSIASGRLMGFDLVAIDEALTGGAEPTDPIDFIDLMRRAGTVGQTPFASVTAPLAIREGVVISDAVRVASGRGVAAGSGLFDLSGWDVLIDLEFELFDHPDAPGFGLTLSGPPRAPQRRVRADALQAYVAGRYADGLTEQFGRRGSGSEPLPADPDAADPTGGEGQQDPVEAVP